MNISGLLNWIKEREAIRTRRAAGDPPPWTEDPIMSEWSFCNVRREDDRVTRWIAGNWRAPHGDDPDLWFAMAVARLVNWPDTMAELGYPVPWDRERFVSVLRARAERGEKVWGDAYNISNGGKTTAKVEHVAGVLDRLWQAHDRLRPRANESLAEWHGRLVARDGLGNFMAAQIVADMKYVPPLRDARDWQTFAASGPGSQRGLNRVLGRPVDSPWKEDVWREKLRHLREAILPELASIKLADLHAQDLQNCLCEFDKSERVRLGEGKPKRHFAPLGLTQNEKPAPSARRRGPEDSYAREGAKASAAAPSEQSRAPTCAAAVAFLQQLRPGGPWVLTAIAPDGPTTTITAHSKDGVLKFVHKHNAIRNIYYSVNPTKEPVNKKAKKADMAAAEFVMADLDPRKDETPEDAKARYMERLALFEPFPSAIVDSGNGIQALWRLDAPVPPDRFAEVEAASRALMVALGGDAGTQNVDRIFRLPGTRNIPTRTKRANGRAECDTSLLHHDETAHALGAFPAAPLDALRRGPSRGAKVARTVEFVEQIVSHLDGLGLSDDPLDLPAPVTPAMVEAALAVIPSDDYNTWWRICAAIRNTFGDAGFAVFESWSRKSWKYEPRQCAQKWHDCAGVKDIHAGTIFHRANEIDPKWREALLDAAVETDTCSGADLDASSDAVASADFGNAKPRSDGNVAGVPVSLPGQKKSRLRSLRTASELQNKIFPPLRWIVPKFLPEGQTLLVGRPKVGKSFMALDVAIAVASGGECLGQKCEQGDVLAFFLEDTERRLQRRMTAMVGVHRGDWPKRLQYAFEWDRRSDGSLSLMREWIETSENPRLVIIDVLQKIRGMGGGKEMSAYSADYDALQGLQKIAGHSELSILVLHHQRKAGADDLFDTVSGTLGLTGAADSVLILGKDQHGTFLSGRGRDLEEFSVAVRQDEKNLRWHVLGPAGEVNISSERAAIIVALRNAGRAMNIHDIARAVQNKPDNVKKLLADMHYAGQVERVGGGVYQLPKLQAEMDLMPDGPIVP
jgi:hypothetical protein